MKIIDFSNEERFERLTGKASVAVYGCALNGGMEYGENAAPQGKPAEADAPRSPGTGIVRGISNLFKI